MNILYFDERELWSPNLDSMLDDLEATQAISVSRTHMQQGKQMALEVAHQSSPDQKFFVYIGDKATMRELHRKILHAYEVKTS